MKINVELYGGKSIFGGKEKPLEKDTIYCDRYNECSLYQKGKCYSVNRLTENCKFGRKTTVRGYTSRTKKYDTFKADFESEECKYNLENAKNIIAKIGDTFVLNIEYLYKNKETGKFAIETHMFNAPMVYIDKNDFDNSLIKLICDGKPLTLCDYKEIKIYQEKIVPKFLHELKTEYSDIYEKFVKEYPEIELKFKNRNYVGEKAYVYSLRDGIELKDCYDDTWIKEKGNLICENYRLSFLPFNAYGVKTTIEINDKMLYVIKNNDEVDENTIFEEG